MFFDWPDDGMLFIPGITNLPISSSLLADNEELATDKIDNGIIVNLPSEAPDTNNTIITLNIEGIPNVIEAPVISGEQNIFIDNINVSIVSQNPQLDIRYTLDGTEPTSASSSYTEPINITESCQLTTALFEGEKIRSDVAANYYEKVIPKEPAQTDRLEQGLAYKYYEGEWNMIPDFSSLTPVKKGIVNNFSIDEKQKSDNIGFEFRGYINIPEDGVYTFYLESDDGSKLYLDGELICDNDNLHSMITRKSAVPLKTGMHSIRVTYFENGGDEGLKLFIKIQGNQKQLIPNTYLFY